MDDCSRQDPAYRPATERPRPGGVFLLLGDGGGAGAAAAGPSRTVVAQALPQRRQRGLRQRPLDQRKQLGLREPNPVLDEGLGGIGGILLAGPAQSLGEHERVVVITRQGEPERDVAS